MTVLGKIKLTGTTGDSTAVFDGIEEIRFLERLQKLSSSATDVVTTFNEVTNQSIKSTPVDLIL